MCYIFIMLTFALSFIFPNFWWGVWIVAVILFLIKSTRQLLITLAGSVAFLKVSWLRKI